MLTEDALPSIHERVGFLHVDAGLHIRSELLLDVTHQCLRDTLQAALLVVAFHCVESPITTGGGTERRRAMVKSFLLFGLTISLSHTPASRLVVSLSFVIL